MCLRYMPATSDVYVFSVYIVCYELELFAYSQNCDNARMYLIWLSFLYGFPMALDLCDRHLCRNHKAWIPFILRSQI